LRLVFYTKTGYFGVGPPFLKAKDKVVIFLGAQVPVAVRMMGPSRHRIVGEVLIPNIMGGEVFKKEHQIERITVGWVTLGKIN
jgi:hypothetical protein